jgi:hexosaminidase
MKCLFIYIFTVFVVQSCTQSPEFKQKVIIPAPVQQENPGGKPFALNSKTVISYSDPSLECIAKALAADIQSQTGLSLRIEPSSKSGNAIRLNIDANEALYESLPETYGVNAKDDGLKNERYLLSISSEGVQITGFSGEGVFRGATTLRHLTGISKATEKIYLPAVRIKDAPLFAWRGLSLDVSRTFFEVDEVKQVIDMLALYKMNVLHLHLTDNQGWRIEIRKYPRLNETGSFMPNGGKKGGYYTQEQYREIVGYAADRFITVVPELDLPGHTAAVFASYPQFRNAAKLNFDMDVAGQAIATLDPDDDEAMQFVKDALTELAAITPGKYIHIGGDETFGMDEGKYIRFINEVRPMVLALGKKMVGWQEITRTDIGENDIFQNWIYFNRTQKSEAASGQTSGLPEEAVKMFISVYAEAPKDIPRGVAKKAKMILSPGGFAYLDHPYAEPSEDPAQENERERLGLKFYPQQTVEEKYNWNVTTFYPEINWKQDIAGVEAAVFCETVEDFSGLQFLLLPRLAGVAEKGWSYYDNNNWEEFKVRLSYQAPLWQNASWNFFKSSLVDWKY